MAKVKEIKVGFGDQNMADMFQQMIGGSGDILIIRDKHDKVSKLISKVRTHTCRFITSPFYETYDFPEWKLEFTQFADETKLLFDEFIPIADDDEMKEFYKNIKENNHMKRLIMVCKELVQLRHHWDEGKLDDSWIMDQPGHNFRPFEFTEFDLKHIWTNCDLTPKIKTYLLIFVIGLFKLCHKIYKLVTSPDIDVKEFSKIIINAIDGIKKIPELSRCGRAFRKIAESVDMLESNFDGYYKDMVSSKNPSSLIEGFIFDVSKNNKMDTKLLFQFNKIIAFYKKQRAKKKKDPKMDALFDNLTNKMSMLSGECDDGSDDVSSDTDDVSSDTDDEKS